MSDSTYPPIKVAMAAGAIATSITIAVPVRNPPHTPHGPPGETVAGPGDRDGGREFGQGVDHGGVHNGREDRGDEQPPPPALGEPELPARNLPGNDVCHPKPSQEYPASC